MSEISNLTFKPREISPGEKILFWLFIWVIPLFILKFAFKTVTDRDEKSHDQILQRNLMNEMESFLQDCRLERFIEKSLARVEEQLGFPPANSSRQFRFYKSDIPPFSAAKLADGFNRTILKKTGTKPLFVFAIGPDGKEIEIRTDPGKFSPVEVPGKRNVQNLLWAISRLPFRLPWANSDFLEDVSKRFGGNTEFEKLRKEVTRFGKIFFGTYAAMFGNAGQCRGFFTHRFGMDRLIIYHRLVTAGESPNSPLLGGYCAGFLESSFSMKTLLRKAVSEKSAGGLVRLWGFRKADPEAGFKKSPEGLSYFHPMPHELLNMGSLHGKSFIQESVGGKKKIPDNLHAFLCIRLPSDQPANLSKGFQFNPETPLVLFLLLTFILTVFGGNLNFFRNLNIRGKLLLAIGLAVGFPLITFWVIAAAYWNFQSRLEVKKELTRMSDRQELIESGVKSFNISHRIGTWKWLDELAKRLSQPGETFSEILDGILRDGGIGALHLLLNDGKGVSKAYGEQSQDPGKTRLDSDYLMDAIGYALLKPSGALSPDFEENLRKNAEGRISLALGHNFTIEHVDQIYRDQGKPLTVQFLGKADSQFNFFFIPPVSSSTRMPGGVLFTKEPFLRIIENYFQNFDNPGGTFSEESGQFLIRSAIYPVAGVLGENDPSDMGWPKEFAGDPDLMNIARLARETGRDGVWSDFSHGYPELFAVRKFIDLPFMVVSHGVYRGEMQNRLWKPLPGLYVFLFSLGLVFILAFLLSRVFVQPINELVIASIRVREGNLEAEAFFDSDDEFSLMGKDFNRMLRGLRERKRLTRFVSEETVQKIAGEVNKVEKTAGVKVRRSILFTHIRHFSAIAESQKPEEILDLLNHYFAEVEKVIRRNKGSIDKYIGDAVMAVFQPLPGGEPEPIRAMKTSWEIREIVKTFNQNRRQNCLFTIETGFGIATGEVISGYIGSRDGRQSLTVIGDTVNLAARLESASELGKESGIIVCPETAGFAMVGFECLPLGEIFLKGKSQSVSTFELVGRIEK